MNRFALPTLVCALLTACGSGGGLPTGASPVMAGVLFEYESSAQQRAENFGCNGAVRIYPSWWGFTHATMVLRDEGSWAAYFENVPVGRQSVRLSPPTGCESSVVIANDVTVSAAGDTQVFAFTVHPDGSVTD